MVAIITVIFFFGYNRVMAGSVFCLDILALATSSWKAANVIAALTPLPTAAQRVRDGMCKLSGIFTEYHLKSCDVAALQWPRPGCRERYH